MLVKYISLSSVFKNAYPVVAEISRIKKFKKYLLHNFFY